METIRKGDEKVLSLGYRNSLQMQMATDLGLTHIAEVKAQELGRIGEINYNTPYLALCVDSMVHLDVNAWKGCHIILDEVESVVEHLLNGSTCREQRGMLLQIWTQLIQGAKRVICADAGLTNSTVDYLEAIRGEKATGVINTYRHTGELRKVYFYGNDYKGIVAEALDRISAGERIVIATDSQVEAEALHKLLLEYDKTNGKRVDSTTKNEPDIEALLNRPNEELERLKLNYLIYSPAIGAGVSIDVDVFDRLYFIGKGVVSASAVMQMLGRVRANIPWHISIPKVGMCDSGNPHETVAEVMARYVWNAQSDLGLAIGSFEEWLRERQEAGVLRPGWRGVGFGTAITPTPFPDPVRRRSENWEEEWIGMLWGAIKTTNTAHHIAHARLKVKDNYERSHLTKVVMERLIEMGCDIEKGESARDINLAGMQEFKFTLKRLAAKQIVDAKDIGIEEARRILKSDKARQHERDAAAKATLKDKLPGVELTLDMVYLCWVEKKGAWLRGVENDWLRKQDGVMERRGGKAWGRRLSEEFVWQSDISTRHLKLKALEKLDIDTLLDSTKEFTAKSPEILEFVRRLKASSHLREVLGVAVGDKTSPIKLINKILEDVLSLNLGCEKRDGERYYSTRYGEVGDFRLDNALRQQVTQVFEAKKHAEEEAET
jgi:hypothetical protein